MYFEVPKADVVTAVVLALGLVGMIVGAIVQSRKRKQEKSDAAEKDREEAAAAGDLDLEHLDRERLRRLRK